MTFGVCSECLQETMYLVRCSVCGEFICDDCCSMDDKDNIYCNGIECIEELEFNNRKK